MAEPVGVGEAWRRTIDVYLSYYQTVGELTVGYLRSVADIMENVQLPARIGPLLGPPTGPRVDGSMSETAGGPIDRSRSSSAAHPEPAMVLEAAAKDEAPGVFLVENRLRRQVSAPVTASTFTDDQGREAQPALRFDPEVVALEPGEQMLVRVIATMSEDLVPGMGYRGELMVPGLSGSPIPIVVRRRASAASANLKPKATARKTPVRKASTRSKSSATPKTKTSRSRTAKRTQA